MKLDVKLKANHQEVAEHIGFGYSIKETADMLQIPLDTVKSNLKVIYKLIGIQKATELAKYLYCTKFNIPLELCEPQRRIISMLCLGVFLFGMANDVDNNRHRCSRRSVRVSRTVNRRNNSL